ncbi:uncharacterized protein LOC144627864 [Crassostrea virginica]
MEPDYSAQDVARCDLCKTAIAQSYCDFCHVDLCKPCIGEHISDEYDKHKIVPIHKRKSTLIYPKCETHQNKTCEYQCKDCNIPICSDCIVAKQHNKEHKFIKLEEVFNAKKKHIRRVTEDLEKQFLPAYEDIANDLELQIASLDGEYKKLSTEMSRQREEIYREVDNAFNQMEKEIGEIKVKHKSILQKHLDEIKQLQSSMLQTLYALNEVEESNEVSVTINYSCKTEEFSKLPPKVILSMPKFIPKMKREDFCCLIGKLSPLSTTLKERVITAKKPYTSVRELLDEPELLNTIKTGHKNLRSVTCHNDEQIWTSGGTADIKCFDIQGVLQKTIQTKSGGMPLDIAVDTTGAMLYYDLKTTTVYKVKNDQTEAIITLQGWTPYNLCVISSGDLLVTMFSDDRTQSKVLRYSGSTVKQTIQFDDEGQPLYSGNCYLKYISQNRNLDICVADFGACAVVVVNQAGKFRFRYTGHSSPTKNERFQPYGITTDSQSRILTSDGRNHCIHILDTDGQFLRYIDNCDLKSPWGVCLDSNDGLFVCEFNEGSVKKIRYSK